MAPFPTNIKELCTPASIYFVISIIALAIVLLQNLGNQSSYTMGSFSCRVPSTTLVFIIKLIYKLQETGIRIEGFDIDSSFSASKSEKMKNLYL